MTRSDRISLAVLLGMLLSSGTAFAGTTYLYTPQPLPQNEKPADIREGILVEEVKIRKGDTLYRLSKQHNRKGGYYPQILLFNNISNPNLIYEGATLKIPIYSKRSRAKAGEAGEHKAEHNIITSGLQARESGGPQAGRAPLPVANNTDMSKELPAGNVQAGGRAADEVHKQEKVLNSGAVKNTSDIVKDDTARGVLTASGNEKAEQVQFESALTAYKEKNFTSAAEQFERFLYGYPNSIFAADATLYKADSYMKLSQ